MAETTRRGFFGLTAAAIASALGRVPSEPSPPTYPAPTIDRDGTASLRIGNTQITMPRDQPAHYSLIAEVPTTDEQRTVAIRDGLSVVVPSNRTGIEAIRIYRG